MRGELACSLAQGRSSRAMAQKYPCLVLPRPGSSTGTTVSSAQELMKRASELFARGNKAPAADDAQKVIDDLHRKIGQLQVERDFLAGQPAISRLLRGGR